MTPNEMAARRKGLGLSRYELSIQTGVSEATLSRWERSLGPMPQHHLLDLAFEALEARAKKNMTRPNGMTAVYYQRGRWVARIKVNGKSVCRSAQSREAATKLLDGLLAEYKKEFENWLDVMNQSQGDYVPPPMEPPNGYVWALQPIRRNRPSIASRLRFEVLERDGYRCRICGATADDGAKLHVDHRKPVAKGGTDDKKNLWTLCQTCNLGKRDHTARRLPKNGRIQEGHKNPEESGPDEPCSPDAHATEHETA